MATKSSFKQSCPSCEAMVPIRDPKLIGRKIDCPKCKYRFVVEEPEEEVDDVDEVEDEEPAKKGKSKAAGITDKKPAKGAKPAKRRPDDDEDEEEVPPKKKKSGGSPMLIVGIGLAAVAVVALAVGAVFLFSGDNTDSPKSKGGGGSANVNQPNAATNNDTKPPTTSKETPPPPKPRLQDVSNLLPNDAQAVLNLPLEHLFANPRLNQALLKTPGAFSEAAFQRVWGVASAEVQRVVLACNIKEKTVFSVMRTRAPLKEEQIVAGLKLKPEAPVGTAKYYLLTKPLDALSTFLLQDAMRMMILGGAAPRDKVALHFLDPFTVVCANVGPMNQFLQEKGQPKHLSKSPDEAAPKSGAPTGPGGAPGMPGAAPGMPGAAPGMPGGPSNMKPPGAPGGTMPGSPGGPPSTGKASGGPPSTGKAGGPPSTGKAGGGPPSTGKVGGGPPSTGRAGGGFQSPPGMPTGGMMPPGMFPGRGSTSDAAPVSTSYLTIDPQLKAVLDQAEKVDGQEGQTVLASLGLNNTSLGAMAGFLTKIRPLLGDKVQNIPEQVFTLGLKFVQDNSKAAGLAVTAFNDSKLDVNAALATEDAKQAKEWETVINKVHDVISLILSKRFGLDIVAKNAGNTTNSGMPNGVPPGMGPGGLPPPGGGFPPPGGGFPPPGGGFPPGTQQPDADKKEEKGKDGDYLVWTKDDVFALGAHVKITKAREDKEGTGLDFVGIYLCDMTAFSDRHSRVHELSAALQGYFEKEGHFPPGTLPRVPDSQHVIDLRPDQRLSWMTQILPYLGRGEFKAMRLSPNKTWYEDVTNARAGFTLIPQFLSSNSSAVALVPYPNIAARGPGLWAATHFVGVAGVGLDAAEYRAGEKLCGVFGYDRQTKKADIKDGLEQTIVAIQVPPEPRSPWIAGGGSTVRGVSDDLDCVRPFVCAKYPNKDGKEEDGTFALMADGKVRFIPATINPKTFQAMCTIAGEDKVSNLDAIAPEVPPPEDMMQQPELKTEVPPPPVVQAPAADKPGLPAGWREIVSKEGRYRVALPPGETKDVSRNQKSAIGEGIVHGKIVTTADKWGVYMVQYMDVASNLADADLDKYRNEVLSSNPGSQARNEKKITLVGRPGSEFHIIDPVKGDLLVHVYLDKNRIYALIARATSGKVAPKDVQTFFDSFQITGP